MKTKAIVLGILLSAMCLPLMSQDTIDTAYYRYGNNFLYAPYPALRDSLTGMLVVDPETGGNVPVCPNGVGFQQMWDGINNIGQLSGFYPIVTSSYKYMYYKIGTASTKNTIYGIAMCLDSVRNFMEGDSMTVTLCVASDDHSHMIHIDSIVIRGGDVGKQRWFEIPITPTDNPRYDINNWYDTIHDCIDTVLYRSVMEFYFDVPHEIYGKTIYWYVNWERAYGSQFLISSVLCQFDAVGYFNYYCEHSCAFPCWDFFFPILTPLPEWEELDMKVLIPEREYNPALHQPDPEDPDPDDPNPEDPDPDDPDPENPNDEGIETGVQNVFKMTPNPADERVTISSNSPVSDIVLYDISGHTVLKKSNCGDSVTLNVSTLRKGVYFVRIRTEDGSTVRKLVVN